MLQYCCGVCGAQQVVRKNNRRDDKKTNVPDRGDTGRPWHWHKRVTGRREQWDECVRQAVRIQKVTILPECKWQLKDVQYSKLSGPNLFV